MIPTVQHVKGVFADARERLCPCMQKAAPKEHQPSIDLLVSVIEDWLARIVDDLVEYATGALEDLKQTEAVSVPDLQAFVQGPNGDGSLRKVDEFPDLDAESLFEAIRVALVDATVAGGQDTAKNKLGIAFAQVPPETLEAAVQHAAELVGKRWVDGTLIDNPNVEFAIDARVRQDVNRLVTKALQDGSSAQDLARKLRERFTHWRAETIARSETAMAFGNGAASVFESASVALLDIFDGPGCLPNGHRDGAPLPSGTPGVIQFEHQANGQVWTVEQYRAHLIGHPNCTRTAAPHVEAA